MHDYGEDMAKPRTEGTRTNARDPVAHHLHIPLTANEHVELHTLAKLNQMTYSELVRQAIRDFAKNQR